jgi:hypothetical protein
MGAKIHRDRAGVGFPDLRDEQHGEPAGRRSTKRETPISVAPVSDSQYGHDVARADLPQAAGQLGRFGLLHLKDAFAHVSCTVPPRCKFRTRP